MDMSSNSRPLVAVTSSVCGRESLGGGRRPVFQAESWGVELEDLGAVSRGMKDTRRQYRR